MHRIQFIFRSQTKNTCPNARPGFFLTQFPPERTMGQGHEGGRLRSQSNQENPMGTRGHGTRESSTVWVGRGTASDKVYNWIFLIIYRRFWPFLASFCGEKAQVSNRKEDKIQVSYTWMCFLG